MAVATKKATTRRATKKGAVPTPEFSDSTVEMTASAEVPAAPRTARKRATKAATPAEPAKAPASRTATKKATPATKAAPAAKRTAKKAAPVLAAVPDEVEETPTPAPAKRTARKTTAKKAPAAKAAPAKKATAKKAAAKKTVPAPAKKTTATKRSAPRDIVTQRVGPGTDEFGFLLGSDSSVAAQKLCEGGTSRGDINRKVEAVLAKTSGLKTRSGKDKVISTIVGNVFLKLQDAGYFVESTWKVVPPQAKRTAAKKTA